jgi:predicted esterase
LNNITLAIDYVVNTRAIQTERIVAVGFSSGAAMAANLFYCYPQTFSGLALHSGLAFKSATGLTEAEDVLLTGSPKSSSTLAFDAFNCDSPRQENLSFKNLVVIHGLADQRVRAINAQQATQQFIGFWDIADDGRFNNSRSLKIKTQKIPDPLFPSLVETTQIDEAAEMTSVSIQNLAHLWAGGSPNKYSEPRALSASNLIIKKLIINKR